MHVDISGMTAPLVKGPGSNTVVGEGLEPADPVRVPVPPLRATTESQIPRVTFPHLKTFTSNSYLWIKGDNI